MRALCPSCGLYHEVVRVLDDVGGPEHRDMYQVAPLETCERSWMSDKDLLEARARFGQDAILNDGDEDE